MCYQKISVKLAFLPIGASIMLSLASLFISVDSAYAGQKALRTVSDLSGLHCRLWMRQNEGRPIAMTAHELAFMLNRPVSQQEAEILRYQYGSIPDFGFVLEKYWEVATRTQRLEFNRLFMALIQQDFPLSIAKEASFCSMNLSIVKRNVEPSMPHKAEFPQPRRFSATAQTAQDDDKPIKTRYVMEQGNIGWGISEIMLNNTGLKAHYGKELQKLIHKGGYSLLLKELMQRTEEKNRKTHNKD